MSSINLYLLIFSIFFALAKSELNGHKRQEVTLGGSVNLYCNITDHVLQNVGWYYVKRGVSPVAILGSQNWGNISNNHYSVITDTISINLTILSLNEVDLNSAYFCYDVSSSTYLEFIELYDSSKLACSESSVFTVDNVQYTYPTLLTCNLDGTRTDDYSWIELTANNSLLYTNSTPIHTGYSYIVFDNTTFSFLYIFGAAKSSFICVRNSDNVFLDIYSVVQCPAFATEHLELESEMGPILYQASVGNIIRFYCDITDSKINDIAWGFVKEGSSPQYIWTYMTGFTDVDLAKTYYNVLFDDKSINLTINSIQESDMDYLYFCVDLSLNKNLVFIELAQNLSECFESKIFETHSITYDYPYTINCNISGLSNNDYYWIKTTQKSSVIWYNGNFNQSSDALLYSVVSNNDTSSLTINNIRGKDAYVCVNSSNDVYLKLHKLVECKNENIYTSSSSSSSSSTQMPSIVSNINQNQFQTTTSITDSFLQNSSNEPQIFDINSSSSSSQPIIDVSNQPISTLSLLIHSTTTTTNNLLTNQQQQQNYNIIN